MNASIGASYNDHTKAGYTGINETYAAEYCHSPPVAKSGVIGSSKTCIVYTRNEVRAWCEWGQPNYLTLHTLHGLHSCTIIIALHAAQLTNSHPSVLAGEACVHPVTGGVDVLTNKAAMISMISSMAKLDWLTFMFVATMVGLAMISEL